MQSWTARLLGLSVLAALLALSAMAQDTPTVIISPAAGEVKSAIFTIEIDGLQPDTRYTIEIVFEGEVVFSSEENSDQAGHIPYPISSTEGDAPGSYTLRVIHDSEVIASGEFGLTEARSPADERAFLGDVTVSPAVAPFGKLQALRIVDLEPRAQYTVEITAGETSAVAYRRSHMSDDGGIIEIDIFAEAGDAAGLQSIAVYDAERDLIAEGEFTIQPLPQRDISVALSPAAVEAGGTVEIAVGGLAAFDSVSAQITSADDVLIDSVLARASSNGDASLSFTAPEHLADGSYDVDIFVESLRLASAILSIGSAERIESEATLSIDPPQGPIGTRHSIDAVGMAADQAFKLIIYDPAGAEEYSALQQADATGAFSLTISSADEDEPGLYKVEILSEDGDQLLTSTSFEIADAENELTLPSAAPSAEDDASPSALPDAIASIDPQSAPIGSSHLVTLRDLRANETVSIDVVFAGATVYRTEKTADASGRVTLELETGEGDQPGDYIVNFRRASGNQPSVILTATAKAAPALTASIIGEREVIKGSLIDGAAEIEFDGEAGQTLLISVASDDFDPAATLIDRDAAKIAYSDDSRGQKDALIGPLKLPYSGEYELVLSAKPLMMPQGAQSGDFTITMMPVAMMPIAFDAAVSFALSEDLPALYYALPAQTGDSLTVSIESGGALDTLLQVVSPAGEEFAFDDDSGSGFDAELSNLIFERAATYTLVISTFDGDLSGAGTVTVSRNPVHSLDDGAVTIRLNDKAIRDLVVFDAAEDEHLVLKLDKVYGDVEDLYVTATIDGMEVMSYSTMGVPAELPLAFVAPMSGRVVVTLEKFGFDDGIALDVSLNRP